MQQIAAKGYVLMALLFCAFIACRFVEIPGESEASVSESYGAEHAVQYGPPFVGASLANSALDPFSSRHDDRLKIVGVYIKSFIVAVSRAESFRPESKTKLPGNQPIWLLNCAMLY